MATALELAALGPASLLLTFRCTARCLRRGVVCNVCTGWQAACAQRLHTTVSALMPPPCSNYILFGLSVGTVSLIAERLKHKDVAAASHALSVSLFLAAASGERGRGQQGGAACLCLPAHLCKYPARLPVQLTHPHLRLLPPQAWSWACCSCRRGRSCCA